MTTYDRPDELRGCLNHLIKQSTTREMQVIVVDNHPASGLTSPVISEYSGITLISEERRGAAYGRNAGILASTGEIIVTTDDDVTMPVDWLENLLAPFADEGIAAVTGNILPHTLETKAQTLFEKHYRLGRGCRAFEVDHGTIQSSKSAILGWEFGATANAAFRRVLFEDPDVGLFDESLGPGTPTGAGEDPYFFYSLVNAGYKLRYEPTAYVWHRHRESMGELRRQIYNYSKSCVAYHITTLLRNGDQRAIRPLLLDLQLYYLARLVRSLAGRLELPVSLVLAELAGHLAGPFEYWRSQRHVKKYGRSVRHINFNGDEKSQNVADIASA